MRDCLQYCVVPPFLRDNIPKQIRKTGQFTTRNEAAIDDKVAKRTDISTNLQHSIEDGKCNGVWLIMRSTYFPYN